VTQACASEQCHKTLYAAGKKYLACHHGLDSLPLHNFGVVSSKSTIQRKLQNKKKRKKGAKFQKTNKELQMY
jgi:hypothetical protein